jgi:hypothetical protein
MRVPNQFFGIIERLYQGVLSLRHSSPELTATRAYWRKKNAPVGAKIFNHFATHDENLAKFCRTPGSILLTPTGTTHE